MGINEYRKLMQEGGRIEFYYGELPKLGEEPQGEPFAVLNFSRQKPGTAGWFTSSPEGKRTYTLEEILSGLE